MITVREVTEENLDDVFRVCSRGKLGDSTRMKGIGIKRAWMREMLSSVGPVSMVAYLDGEPAAQAMFYPEAALPYEPHPRSCVLRLECVYNSAPEARGKGVGKALLGHLVEEAGKGLRCMSEPCRFIAAEAFNTGEGLGMRDFYLANGFVEGRGELYRLVHGGYEPKRRVRYRPKKADRGRALVFFNRNCEYSYPFALRIEEALSEVAPELPVTFIDIWDEPEEPARRGVSYLVVNARPINSHIGNRDAFKAEVAEALKPREA